MKNVYEAIEFLETTSHFVAGSKEEELFDAAIGYFDSWSASSMFGVETGMENEGADLTEAEIEEIEDIGYYYRLAYNPVYATENDGVEEGSEEAEDYESIYVESDFVIIEDKVTKVFHISNERCYGDLMRSIWEARKAVAA
jgi:hypothetical protein